MTLLNHLPHEYEQLLSYVVYGDKSYYDVCVPLFRKLNPSRVNTISAQMSTTFWSLERRLLGVIRTKNGFSSEFMSKTLQRRPELAALFSVSHNGYLRESAVKKWGRVDSPFELALLLLRLNDWVEPVRLAAAEKLEMLMNSPVSKSGLSEANIMGCMDLILNLDRFGRIQEVEAKVLNQILNIDGIGVALTHLVTHSVLDVAPRYLRLALKRGLLLDALSMIAQDGKHPEVRRIAVNSLLNRAFAWKVDGEIKRRKIDATVNRDNIARNGLNDKSPAVRCLALDYIAEHKPESLYKEKTFRAFANDKRNSILDRAVFGLKTLGVDFVQELRGQVCAGDFSIHSLEILARFGSRMDGDLIAGYVDQVASNERIRAYGAAASLGNALSISALEKIVFGAYEDKHAYAASQKLRKTIYTSNYPAIMQAIRDGSDPYTRGYLLLLPNLPTMQLALILIELEKLDFEYDYSNLWAVLRKKRNVGAFIPKEEEVILLQKGVANSEALKSKVFNVLGL